MSNFIRADQMPLPDARSLGERVHGFMDANPQLGQNPGGGFPSRRANRLFQDLMQYYDGSPKDIQAANGVLTQMGYPIDTSEYPAGAEDMALLDSPLGGFMSEAFVNESAKQSANRLYDGNQPYGLDFGDEHAARFVGLGDAEDAFAARPDGSVMSNQGQIVSTPDGYNASDGVGNLALPILRTAGSYALPMLFSMLMRGGK